MHCLYIPLWMVTAIMIDGCDSCSFPHGGFVYCSPIRLLLAMVSASVVSQPQSCIYYAVQCAPPLQEWQ